MWIFSVYFNLDVKKKFGIFTIKIEVSQQLLYSKNSMS